MDTFLKKHPVPIYGCADTLDTLESRSTIPPAVEAIPVDGQTLEIGGFTVTSFPTSHDVPCCGYRVRTPDDRTMALATDLGYLTDVYKRQATLLAGSASVPAPAMQPPGQAIPSSR